MEPACESLEPRRLFSALVHQELHRPQTAVADLNGDGLADLVTAVLDGFSKGVAQVGLGVAGVDVMINDGEGGFDFAGHTDCDDDAALGVWVAAGDVDGDGLADIAVLRVSPADINGTYQFDLSLLRGDGKGGFGGQRSFFLPHVLEFADDPTASTVSGYNKLHRLTRGGVRVAVGDVNGDGVGDIVTSVLDDHAVALGERGVGPRQSTSVDGSFSHGLPLKREAMSVVGLGDLDGDGLLDLVATQEDSLLYVGIDFSTGKPAMGKVKKVEALTIKQTTHVALGDLDGDGVRDDLAVFEDGHASMGLNDAAGGFRWVQVEGPLAVNPDDVLVGDVDGDGTDELFTFRSIHDGKRGILSIIR